LVQVTQQHVAGAAGPILHPQDTVTQLPAPTSEPAADALDTESKKLGVMWASAQRMNADVKIDASIA
jgi:hypothetical protein